MGVTHIIKHVSSSHESPLSNLCSQLLQPIPGYSAALSNLISEYELLSMPYRKALLLITRVRPIVPNPQLLDHVPVSYYPSLVQQTSRRRLRFRWYDIITSVIAVSRASDIGNSILSSFFRSKLFPSGLNEELEKAEFRDSLDKEIAATQGDDRPQVLDYDVWFGSTPDSPLFPGCPPRPRLNISISWSLDAFRKSFEDKLLYPKASRKHMSSLTAKSMGYTRVTGEEYLRYLYQGGVPVESPMEVRQAWRYNDLSPRTYFCQGGAVFNKSMYAQEIFNSLIDSFEVSHRRRRFDLSRLLIDDEDDVWVYDYSSFTSNFTEQKYFLGALAEFCKGYPLYVVDVTKGPTRYDLGRYLDEYNRACNILPEFYLGPEVLRKLDMTAQSYIHRRAGALGVYGNLASCTVLHGLFQMNVTGSARKSSVVGDDGLAVKRTTEALEVGEIDEDLTSIDGIRGALRLLGDVHERKFAILSCPRSPYESVWTYLKRSLIRHENHLELLDQEHILNVALVLRETAKTMRQGNLFSMSGVKSFVSQTLNLLLRVHRDQTAILDEELRSVCMLLSAGYRYIGLDQIGTLIGQSVIPEKRSIEGSPAKTTQFWLGHIIPHVPSLDLCYRLRDDPIETLLELHDWSQPIPVPEIELHSVSRSWEVPSLLGSTFRSTGGKAINFGVRLGIFHKEIDHRNECCDAIEFREFRLKLQDFRYGLIYDMTVINEFPWYLSGLLEGAYM